MGTHIHQNVSIVVEIYEKKSRKELVTTEPALVYSVWKNKCLCPWQSGISSGAPTSAGGSSSAFLWETQNC